MYSAIMDDRVRSTHAAPNGKVYPLDHPYWHTWWPPNGCNCRCTVRTLTATEVEERGLAIETEVPESVQGMGDQWLSNRPDAGYAYNPGR
jgi:uncharacterized protein with gpF-like domain